MNGGFTGTKNIPKEVSYNVKLFVDEDRLPKDCWFSIEKVNPANGEFEGEVRGRSKERKGEQEEPEDLLGSALQGKELALVIEDNTTRDDPRVDDSPREKFYDKHGLTEILKVWVPFRIEVRKFVGQSSNPVMMEHNEVNVVLDIIDPQENIENIRGPRQKGRSGKEFIKKFITKKNGKLGENDNCSCDFVAAPFRKACNHPIWYDHSKGSIFVTYLRSGSTRAVASFIQASLSDNGESIGVTNVFFRPPIIFGNNFKIKVAIKNKAFQDMPLRNDNSDPYFETPTITLWKRVKIHMSVSQRGFDYDKIKWNEVKNVFRDAFIDIEEPPKKRVFDISIEDWMNYLDYYVYGAGNRAHRDWRLNTWQFYKSNYSVNDHKADFSNFSFPQDRVYKYKIKRGDNLSRIAQKFDMTLDELRKYKDGKGVSNQKRLERAKRRGKKPAILVPLRFVYSPDKGDSLLLAPEILLENIFWDKVIARFLEAPFSWSRSEKPFEGRRVGLCLFLAKLPRPKYHVSGKTCGHKLIIVFQSKDVTHTLVHEIGHALFLDHGFTWVRRGYAKNRPPQETDAAFGESWRYGNELPKEDPDLNPGLCWDEHDSEDMVSCVMSYLTDYYDSDGTVLKDTDHPLHLKVKDHPTDWHFCGLCLLKLRFCHLESMLRANNDSLRQLQYTKKAMIAVEGAPYRMPNGAAANNISFPRSLSIEECENVKDAIINNKRLFVFYPKESVYNNLGDDPYKDITHLTKMKYGGTHRARWKSDNPEVVEVVDTNLLWGKKPRLEANITFELFYGQNFKETISTDAITVYVTPKMRPCITIVAAVQGIRPSYPDSKGGFIANVFASKFSKESSFSPNKTAEEIGVGKQKYAATKVNSKIFFEPSIASSGRSVAKTPGNALIIGNDDYDESKKMGSYGPVCRKLESCVGDANKIEEALKRKGKKDGFNIKKLTNLSGNKIKEAIEAAKESLKPESSFLFYFSGHGTFQGLIGVDGDPVFPDDISDIVKKAITINSDLVILIDACHSGVIVDRCRSVLLDRAKEHNKGNDKIESFIEAAINLAATKNQFHREALELWKKMWRAGDLASSVDTKKVKEGIKLNRKAYANWSKVWNEFADNAQTKIDDAISKGKAAGVKIKPLKLSKFPARAKFNNEKEKQMWAQLDSVDHILNLASSVSYKEKHNR